MRCLYDRREVRCACRRSTNKVLKPEALRRAVEIGVEYDPEDWLARLRAGAPVSDFLVRHEPVSPVRGSIAS